MEDCQSLGNCEDARMERIYEYLDGALSRQDLDDIRTHLETCPECASEYDLECIIRSVVRRSCKEAAPSSLKSSILNRISEIQAVDH
jgi:anti-sigma factor (TIGR02949 family)